VVEVVPLRRNRPFQLLRADGAVSQLSAELTRFALPFLVLALTGSPDGRGCPVLSMVVRNFLNSAAWCCGAVRTPVRPRLHFTDSSAPTHPSTSHSTRKSPVEAGTAKPPRSRLHFCQTLSKL
jgi:hypothetical protein